jgi:[ribosomal protein S18]-alanine N-acetyltransferase
MSVKIETATIRLLDQLYAIEEQCFSEEAFSRRQIAYLLTDYNSIALVAKSNIDIAGFIIAQVEVEGSIEYGHIVTLNIPHDYRRKHVATRLLQEIQAILRQRGITEIRLEVREDNHAAIKLYQTLGKLEKYYGKKHGLYLKKTF